MESLDEVFELFSEERRRYALYYLDEAEGPVEVRELASQIQEWEDGSDPPALGDDYRDIVLELEHTDLPKAARAEYVHYDPEEDIIELSGSSPEFEIVLSVAEAIEQPGEDHLPHLG